jgi:hypothetical protein
MQLGDSRFWQQFVGECLLERYTGSARKITNVSKNRSAFILLSLPLHQTLQRLSCISTSKHNHKTHKVQSNKKLSFRLQLLSALMALSVTEVTQWRNDDDTTTCPWATASTRILNPGSTLRLQFLLHITPIKQCLTEPIMPVKAYVRAGRCPGAWAYACACACVALLTQHATPMRHIVLSFVASLAPLHISTISHKRHDLRENVTVNKICFDFFHNFYLKQFSF